MRISFEINDVKHTLYFGMDAYEIVAEKSFKATIENNVSNFKMCSYIIFGGLINEAVIKELPKPDYEVAYELMQEIVQQPEEFQNKIFTAWEQSLANKELQKILNANKKKVEVKKRKTLAK